MIPSALTREDISIEPYQGNTAYDESYGSPVNEKARVEGRRRRVKRADGVEIVSSATAYVRSDTSATMQARITWQTRQYEVVDMLPITGLHGIEGYELLLS